MNVRAEGEDLCRPAKRAGAPRPVSRDGFGGATAVLSGAAVQDRENYARARARVR